jgi:hypothetical protein
MPRTPPAPESREAFDMPQSRNRVTVLPGKRSYNPDAMKKVWWRGVIEVAFIIFLFYSNLLMGEFERSGDGWTKGLIWALSDMFTIANFVIALTAALIGYLLFEFLRTKF